MDTTTPPVGLASGKKKTPNLRAESCDERTIRYKEMSICTPVAGSESGGSVGTSERGRLASRVSGHGTGAVREGEVKSKRYQSQPRISLAFTEIFGKFRRFL